MLAAAEPWVLVYVVALFGVAIGFIWYATVVQRRTFETWRRFAAERGLRFAAPEAAWYQRKTFRIEGEVRGVAFTIQKEVVRHGKHSRVYTRLEAQGVERTRSELKLVTNDLSAKLSKFFGRKATPLGDAEFDRHFVLHGEPNDGPREVLHDALRAKLVEFAPLVEFTLCRDRLVLRWSKLEPNPERLQRAIELAVLAFATPRVAVAR